MMRALALALTLLCGTPSHSESPLRARVRSGSTTTANKNPAGGDASTPSSRADPQWKNYLNNLAAYQRSFPGIYMPLDLVRWDKIPDDWLRTQVRKHGLAWERSESKAMSFEERRTQRIVVSRKANQELFEAQKALESKGTLWVGSTRDLLDTFATDERLALTPLDEAFQSSELGGELFKRFAQKSSGALTGFLIDPKAKRLILEIGSEGGPSSPSKAAPGSPQYFKIDFDDSASKELRIRPSYGREERLGADISMRKENFRGYLLNASSGEKLPLGPYPLPKNRWVDENGTGHFHGDGHKH